VALKVPTKSYFSGLADLEWSGKIKSYSVIFLSTIGFLQRFSTEETTPVRHHFNDGGLIAQVG